MTKKTIAEMDYGDMFLIDGDLYIKILVYSSGVNRASTLVIGTSPYDNKAFSTQAYPLMARRGERYEVLMNTHRIKEILLQHSEQ